MTTDEVNSSTSNWSVMEQIQTNAVLMVAMVSQYIQFWLRKVLLWLIDEEGERTVKSIGESRHASC